MHTQSSVKERDQNATATRAREQLLAGLPVKEQRMDLAGISTAVLEGGEGPPVILLHGPGEFAAKWLRIIPDLVSTHHIVAPDLPGHGATRGPDQPPDADQVFEWLDNLIEETCSSPPTLVGHIVGGAIAARFTIENGARVDRLVLVDSLGLGSFRPSLRFALTMIGFMIRPTEGSYSRFMRQCSYDLEALQEEMGDRWDAFVRYNLDRARSPKTKIVRHLMRTVGVPRIPQDDLAQITVPTTLIWGRQDRALDLQIAEDASAQYGWPLHVIENCADDPPLDQPEAFLDALYTALGPS